MTNWSLHTLSKKAAIDYCHTSSFVARFLTLISSSPLTESPFGVTYFFIELSVPILSIRTNFVFNLMNSQDNLAEDKTGEFT